MGLKYIIAFLLWCEVGAILPIPPNAGSSVSKKLIKCYNDSVILQPDNRLPLTIDVLIALIRKIEENNKFVNNREISLMLLQHYRQDGITKSLRGDQPSQYGIPFSPKRWDSYRNKVILEKLIPNIKIYEDSYLTDLEMCSLHFMISKTVDDKARGDEMTVCNQLGKYRMRSRRKSPLRSELTEPVEQFGSGLEVLSQCPVEYGVIRTKWGSVLSGNVLAGLAAGFNKQQIGVTDGVLDSRYGATIAGDLAEAALYQILSKDANIIIGADGSWNSTLEPKWYFLHKNHHLQVTDAEIRGGLDGLYLSFGIDNIKQKFPNIKISQILDLYYSPRGVLNSTLRACNRKPAETSVINNKELIEQIGLFESFLDPIATLDSSIDPSKYKELASYAVKSFNQYLSSGLRDSECSDNETIYRASTDITIFLDFNWMYSQIHPMISYLLENIDINPYESTYSIINAKTGEILVNKSKTILDFYQNYNETIHEQGTHGMDYAMCLDEIESLVKQKLSNSDLMNTTSQIFLMLPFVLPNSNQKSYAEIKVAAMKKTLPDFRILILGPGQKEQYKEYLLNPDRDIILMPDITNSNSVETEAALKSAVLEVSNRIKEIPRAIINPKCGPDFEFDDKNTFSLVDFVEPQGLNIYRIQPSYFFNSEENSKLILTGQGYGSLEVCVTQSRDHPTNPPKSCQTINNDNLSFNLNEYCDDKSFEECDPLYISIRGGINSYIKCADAGCRFPDNIKFLIVLERVGCYKSSGAVFFLSSFVLGLILCLKFVF